jgi:hypothetical protein
MAKLTAAELEALEVYDPGAPPSMVADNDYATGQVIDALSHSPFWKNTLIFITEDDTQASGDHVDGHRTFLLTSGGLARQLGPQGKSPTRRARSRRCSRQSRTCSALAP